MGLGSWLAEKVGNTAGELIESVGSTVDRFVETDEDRRKMEILKQEIAIKMKQFEMDAQAEFMKDKQSAREMYQRDSWSQKALTALFTVGYFGLTAFMISFLLKAIDVDMSPFVVSFISTIFGAFNAIMVQIISFYFGSSQGGEDTGRAISRSFNDAAKNKEQNKS